MNAPRIGLFLITKNEITRIARCLKSAENAADEIIVVDDSSDGTADEARRLGAAVFTRPFDGFTAQKNFALRRVKAPWALSLDADEELTPKLAKEIRRAVERGDADGFELTRVNYFLGRRMKYGGLKKEHILRLARTDLAEYRGGLVHEKLRVRGQIKRLKNVFIHHSYEDIETYFNKFNKYTTLAAQTLYEKRRRVNLPRVLATVPFEFFRRYALKGGFLDGMRGFMWAAFSAFYVFVKYMKLWFLWERERFTNE